MNLNRAAVIHADDDDVLALLGKKQVLKRRFGFWSILGFAVCELITWETVLALFAQSFNNGGPAGAIYGFIIAWASTLSVYTVIAELASFAPIAGGQYYWVYMLAPQRWKVFSSYIVGWLTTLAWIATVATETIFAGTILQGLIILDYPNTYEPQLWHGTLLAWMVVAVAIFINAVIPGALPKFEIFIVVFHIAGFIAIVSVLWVFTTPKNTSEFVWTTSLNEGGWPTQGLSYCVGFIGNVATFVGADASVHLVEETENAARNIPRAIVTSMFINGMVGFVMMITLLYNLGDVDQVLNTATGYPFIQIFYGKSISHIPPSKFVTLIPHRFGKQHRRGNGHGCCCPRSDMGLLDSNHYYNIPYGVVLCPRPRNTILELLKQSVPETQDTSHGALHDHWPRMLTHLALHRQ